MRSTIRAKALAWLAENQPQQIGPAEFEALKQALAPVSDSYLRKQLRESGATLVPLIDGVRQGNLDELEASLLALLGEYESGNRQAARKLVITAKDHARWTHKEENLLWLTTWLENPPLFPTWVKLRRSL